MKRLRKAKILATLGPASSSPEAIRALYEAGADVFRLNFSHGSYEDHRQRFETIRALEQEVRKPIGVLMDLQGPNLRVGKFEEGKVELEEGQAFRLDLDTALGNKERAPLPHPEILSVLEPGSDLLLDDGRIRLRVTHNGNDFAETIVVVGGLLSNHKGVNVPGVMLPISPLTEKDRADLAFGLELGVDWVALSFVQHGDDVKELRSLIDGKAWIISKLEKPAAIAHLDDIIELSDAVMVARGDLGVECPPEEVPQMQKRIARSARSAGKPVVVATQMLESMIEAPTPTRPEATDVAAAIYDGVDAVMLSAETAAGKYSIEAVSIMDRIIVRTERDPHYQDLIKTLKPTPVPRSSDAVCAAMSTVTEMMPISVTITYTDSGSTSLRAARERPQVPILGLTPQQETARRLSLVWGVYAVTAVAANDLETVVQNACLIAAQEGFARVDDHAVITAGMPFRVQGNTNLLRIVRFTDEVLRA